jgi:hypothetical protein
MGFPLACYWPGVIGESVIAGEVKQSVSILQDGSCEAIPINAINTAHAMTGFASAFALRATADKLLRSQ